MRRTAALVALAAAAFAAAAPAEPRVAASLRIRVWPDGASGTSATWTLRCTPVGGTLPRAARACRVFASLHSPFAPVPPDVACSQIYSGPQEALVTGTFAGRHVLARFNRRDGCQTARWDRIRVLFPVAT